MENKSHFGFLIVDKPSGITSHDCVNIIRKIFNTKRVGHGGTLDPLATGVLPIAIGSATRLFKYLRQEKAYQAIIQLGKKTFTDDIHGKIIIEQKWPQINAIFLDNLLETFRGPIKQKPPLISSVHHEGERAYKKAREGKEFELPERNVTINKLKLLQWDQLTGQIRLNIDCSAGTYIRSLARDLGDQLNCGGCLLSLRRIQSQGFKEEQAILLKDFKDGLSNLPILINPLEAMKHLSQVKILMDDDLRGWRMGKRLIFSKESSSFQIVNQSKDTIRNTEEPIVLIDFNNEIAGIGIWEVDNIIKPKVVFNACS